MSNSNSSRDIVIGRAFKLILTLASGWISTKTIAEELEISRRHLSRYIQSGTLSGLPIEETKIEGLKYYRLPPRWIDKRIQR